MTDVLPCSQASKFNEELERNLSSTPAAKLAGAISIWNGDSVREILVSPIAGGCGLVLDLGAVESCDCTTVQLLCSAQKTAAQRGVGFKVIAWSSALEELLLALGLDKDRFSNCTPENSANAGAFSPGGEGRGV